MKRLRILGFRIGALWIGNEYGWDSGEIDRGWGLGE